MVGQQQGSLLTENQKTRGDIRVTASKRTSWEKLLILHGVHCGYREAKRLPADRDRIQGEVQSVLDSPAARI